jgi:hypothetical protein
MIQRDEFKQKSRQVCAAVQQEDLKFCNPEPSFGLNLYSIPLNLLILIIILSIQRLFVMK